MLKGYSRRTLNDIENMLTLINNILRKLKMEPKEANVHYLYCIVQAVFIMEVFQISNNINIYFV